MAAMVEHDQDKDGSQEDERTLSLLKSTVQKSTPSVTCNRQDYETRLLSFQVSTYYAKPACLSPLVCARFGWNNADKDMLSCSLCKGALSVSFPAPITVHLKETICAAYREQLATAHATNCPYRLEAEEFLRLSAQTKSRATLIPSHLAAVFPRSYVALMEHPKPSTLLCRRAEQIQNCLPEGDSPAWKFPTLVLSEELQTFRLNGDGDDGSVLEQTLSLLSESIGNTSLLLAHLGWMPVENLESDLGEQTDSPVVTLGCPVCLSTMEITLVNSENTDEERPPKKPKRLARHCNPLDAHRHYCPLSCGFPTTISAAEATPLWQSLLQRLHNELAALPAGKESEADSINDPDETINKVRKILWSGIAPRKVVLSTDELEEAEG